MHQPRSPVEIFQEIFSSMAWKGSVPSGPGSTLAATALVRPQLQALFGELQIKTLIDAACGDGTWIFEITEKLDLYLGFDIVPQLIAANQERGLPLNYLFRTADISTEKLPRGDAILCRDCLVHMPLENAADAIRLFGESGSTYLIATTFPDLRENISARMGTWRPLNLQRPPFDLPAPLHLLRERGENPNDKYKDKSLGVWRL